MRVAENLPSRSEVLQLSASGSQMRGQKRKSLHCHSEYKP